jgi:hypothetical protein
MTHMLALVDARFDLKLADWLLALRVLFMEMPVADRALIMSSFEEIPSRIAKGE